MNHRTVILGTGVLILAISAWAGWNDSSRRLVTAPEQAPSETSEMPLSLAADDISVEDLAAMQSAGMDAVLVGVALPGGTRIPGTDIVVADGASMAPSSLPADRTRPLIVYGGKGSREAARSLSEAGYENVYHVVGGLDAWVAAGSPTEESGAGAE